MKVLSMAAAILLAAGIAWAFQKQPVNDTCPVKNEPVKNITTVYNGKTVAFC